MMNANTFNICGELQMVNMTEYFEYNFFYIPLNDKQSFEICLNLDSSRFPKISAAKTHGTNRFKLYRGPVTHEYILSSIKQIEQ